MLFFCFFFVGDAFNPHSIALAEVDRYLTYNFERNIKKNQSAEHYAHGRNCHTDTCAVMFFKLFHFGIAVNGLVVGARSNVLVFTSAFYFPFLAGITDACIRLVCL